jgi:hypothetical protein
MRGMFSFIETGRRGVGTSANQNGKKIGEGCIEKTTPFEYALFEGQDIGESTGTPVDFSYTPRSNSPASWDW